MPFARPRIPQIDILRLPRFMRPWTRAQERVDDLGRFTFDVEIGLPGIGRLVRYRGWLDPSSLRLTRAQGSIFEE